MDVSTIGIIHVKAWKGFFFFFKEQNQAFELTVNVTLTFLEYLRSRTRLILTIQDLSIEES